MSSHKLPNIPSLRRQQLHLEFASLRTNPPPGVYVTLSPNDPALWAGVIFVQKGPYASAILHLQIRFPQTYPSLPPVVTFTTDIFHPLIVPLTAYTSSSSAATGPSLSSSFEINPTTTTATATATASSAAADEEWLSGHPGGYSLQHGFPHWFGRAVAVPGVNNVKDGTRAEDGEEEADDDDGNTVSKDQRPSEGGEPPQSRQSRPSTAAESHSGSTGHREKKQKKEKMDVPVLDLLNYIRSTFDSETVLDSIPLEAAGNPSAWHAWQSHSKASNPKTTRRESIDRTTTGAGGARRPSSPKTRKKNDPQSRLPGQWNWEGVWAKRAQDGVQASFLESVLFGASSRRGGGSGDELIRFSKLDRDLLDKLKRDMIGSQASSKPTTV